MVSCSLHPCFFFINDPQHTEIYTLSLHDALPIFQPGVRLGDVDHHPHRVGPGDHEHALRLARARLEDRKSTRLNSSHLGISYAVFCLKKKKVKTADNITGNITPLTTEVPTYHTIS